LFDKFKEFEFCIAIPPLIKDIEKDRNICIIQFETQYAYSELD